MSKIVLSTQTHMNFIIPVKRFCNTGKYRNVLFSVSLVILLFTSCSAPKNAYYFKTLPGDTTINTAVNRLTESVIRKNDQLAITISSLNPEEDRVYNAAALSISTAGSGANAGGYQVDLNGNIQLHRLGNLHAEGMTRRELKNKIETDIKPYLKDPVVTVRYLNHRVTVIGEVAQPQVIAMPEEHLSILELLGSSGDVSVMARKDNILIIRETETGKKFKRLNLEDHSVFNSEWYYLQPNDVVYIEPGDKKLKEEKRARLQQNISLAVSGISLAIIILDRIIR